MSAHIAWGKTRDFKLTGTGSRGLRGSSTIARLRTRAGVADRITTTAWDLSTSGITNGSAGRGRIDDRIPAAARGLGTDGITTGGTAQAGRGDGIAFGG